MLEPPIFFQKISLTGDSQDFDPLAGVRCERVPGADRSGTTHWSAQPRALLMYIDCFLFLSSLPAPLSPELDRRFP